MRLAALLLLPIACAAAAQVPPSAAPNAAISYPQTTRGDVVE